MSVPPVLPPVPGETTPAEPAPSEVSPPQPAEVAGPPPSEVAPPITMQPPRMVEIEVPRTPPPPPPANGRGMLIGAAVTGIIGGAIRIATTVGVIRDIRDGSSSDPILTTVAGSFFYSPFIATAIGLAGGGMGRRGRFDAHNELFEGKPASRLRRPGLGWGLFGGGVGVWLVTRIAGMTACPTDACVARVWETGYYLSLAGTVPGVMMGAYGSGFNGHHKRYRHLADVTVAPLAHRGAWGMGVSGRF